MKNASVFIQNKKMHLVLRNELRCQEGMFCTQAMPHQVITLNVERIQESNELCTPITYQASTMVEGLFISANLTVILQSDDCQTQGGQAMLDLITEEQNHQIYTSTLLFKNINDSVLGEDVVRGVPTDSSLIDLPIVVGSI